MTIDLDAVRVLVFVFSSLLLHVKGHLVALLFAISLSTIPPEAHAHYQV